MPTTPSFFDVAGVSRSTAEVLERAGITTPFPIQAQVIPSAANGLDVIAESPTGSGKTIAFGIPLVERIDIRQKGPQALVLVPTRELAVQVVGDIAPIAEARNITVAAVYGGAGQAPQVKAVKHASIVVATPGRLDDLIGQRLVRLDGIHMLVLDEADRMLDMGFQPQVDRILRALPDNDRQTMLFSATLDDGVRDLARRYTYEPKHVRVKPVMESRVRIDHLIELVTRETRIDALVHLLGDAERDLAAVFVRTKRGAQRLDKKLRQMGLNSTAIHGAMTQSARLRELGRFRDGKVDTIIATDVFARGIDLDRITHVVNFDLPGDADTYMHRVGRTGRAGRSGTAITFVLPDQVDEMEAIAAEIGLVGEDDDDTQAAPAQQPASSTNSAGAGSNGNAGGSSRRRRGGRGRSRSAAATS
jgi:superfamily II DNA/RNA helicase